MGRALSILMASLSLMPLTGCLRHELRPYIGQWELQRDHQVIGTLELMPKGRSLRGTLQLPSRLRETNDGSGVAVLEHLDSPLQRVVIDHSYWRTKQLMLHVTGDQHLTAAALDTRGKLHLSWFPPTAVPPLVFTRPGTKSTP